MSSPVRTLPDRLRATGERWLATAPGRFLVGVATEISRVEIFDRAMTLAAQIFTSVFPVLILLATFLSRDLHAALTESTGMPAESQQLLKSATENSSTSVSIVGVLLVLLSATSLSRALGRFYAAAWWLPRPRSRPAFWWRWVAVVLGLALALVAVRPLLRLAAGLVPEPVWSLGFLVILYSAVLWLVAYILLMGQVPWRALLPGAVLAGVAVALVSRYGGSFVSLSLTHSQQRYGIIGVAFTYLGFLYVVAFSLIAATVIGAVVVRADTPFARWCRRDWIPPRARP